MLWVGSSRTSYLRRRRRSLFECVLFECVYKHSMTSMLNWIPSTFCHTLFCLSVPSKTIISINSNYCFEFCWEVSLSGSSFFRVALAGAKRRLVFPYPRPPLGLFLVLVNHLWREAHLIEPNNLRSKKKINWSKIIVDGFGQLMIWMWAISLFYQFLSSAHNHFHCNQNP